MTQKMRCVKKLSVVGSHPVVAMGKENIEWDQEMTGHKKISVLYGVWDTLQENSILE